jgi:molybdopterin molybdotransferase
MAVTAVPFSFWGQGVTTVLSYSNAAAVVEEHASRVLGAERRQERVPLGAALARVLAEPLVADRDQPPFARSTRDGFACRAVDLGGALQVVGLLRAGESWATPLVPGDALEIMTGAPVPAGADSVVMVEHVSRIADSIQLASERMIEAGDNIVPAGAEARAGAVVVPPSVRITAAQIAAAAMCGYAQVEVWARPRVAVLATGDELVSVDATPEPFQIRNSNTHSLAAQVTGAGGEPILMPPAPDDPSRLRVAIEAALEQSELLLLSGGVSMGKFDFVEQVLLDLGAEFLFTGAKIQPGKPVVFGRVRGRYFFGLPGNPVSTMVTFLLFVAPLLRALGGEAAGPRFVQTTLLKPVERKAGLTRFLPARLHTEITGSTAEPIPWQGSGDLAAIAQANCFVVAPGGADGVIEAGTMVAALLPE